MPRYMPCADCIFGSRLIDTEKDDYVVRRFKASISFYHLECHEPVIGEKWN